VSKLGKVTNLNFEKLKALAEENGVKMKYFCDQFGKQKSFMTDIKNKKNYLTEEQLVFIANHLNTTVDYLTDKTDQKEKPIDQMTDEQLDNALIDLLVGLSPDEVQKVEAFIAGLKAARN
jgi:transcriptional regulator with XRE-family HTH domain